jgi:hypothetical protein
MRFCGIMSEPIALAVKTGMLSFGYSAFARLSMPRLLVVLRLSSM